MKTIYGLFSLIIILLIAACSDSAAGPDDFQGQRIGNFLTTSESTAKWVGNGSIQAIKANSTSAIQTDTVFYGQPEHNSLKIATFQDTDTLFVNAIYIDSTLTRAFYDSTDAQANITWGDSFNEPVGQSYDDQATRIETGVPFSCDSTFTLPGNLIKIFIPSDEGGIYEVINIDARGFYEATDALVCH